MKKLKFTGTINFRGYHSHLIDFEDGETKEVPEDLADYLLGDFSAYFEEVKTREISEPIKHRMITTEAKTKARKTTRRKPKK